jgi:hypothetical protein
LQFGMGLSATRISDPMRRDRLPSPLTKIDPALLIGIDPLTCFLPTLYR